MSNEVLGYGITRRRPAGDEVDRSVEEIEYSGYTVIDSGLSDEQLKAIGQAFDQAYERQTREADAGSAQLDADADILRCPLAYDDVFLTVATAPTLLEVCRRVLGSHFVLLQQNGIINRPATKEYQSRWHRDLPYQHFVASKKLALNALLCVEPFTVETGGTNVLPGSHLFEEFPSDGYVRKHERATDAKAGSFLVLDAMLYHRSGYNRSNGNRRGINHVIGLPMLAQQIDIPRLLQGRHGDDPLVRDYLGYRWNPASSVNDWRRMRQ
jgi:ectoine hydroxylase-related dioxygenase (phytanoyl-CoA dioxygenase family)